ncbi:unnamed protein product [Ectocarpus sp. 6 AP-2014]
MLGAERERPQYIDMVFWSIVNGCALLEYGRAEFDVFTWFFRYIGVRHGSCCDGCLRCCCFFPQIVLEFVLCACLGPLPWAFLACWSYFGRPRRDFWRDLPDLCCFCNDLHLWRRLRNLCRFCIDLPRQAARRKTHLAVDRLRRFPSQKSWQARGWLIMMRGRHRRSLARSKGWRARLRKLERYDEANIIKYAMRDFMGGQTPPEIELLEAGRLKMNFVRAVIAVVEIEEEGLFRHIISYL